MNIQIQSYGLFVLVLLFIFYKTSRTLQLYSEKVYRRALYISTISLCLDILSLVGIEFMDSISIVLVFTICKLYIMSLIWVAVAALSYVMTDLYPEKKHVIVTRLLGLLGFAESIVVGLLPISINRGPEGYFTYGPSVLAVYAFALIHILSIIVVMIVCGKRISKRRRFAVSLWVTLWIAAAIIQYLNNQLLVVGFASAIGMLIIFIIMENPESYRDRRTGCFNSYALSEFSHRLYERKTKFSLLEIRLKGSESRENNDSTDNALKKTVSLASGHKELFVFRNMNNIIILSENAELLKNFGCELLAELDKLGKLVKNRPAVFVEHGETFIHMSELFQFLSFVNNTFTETSEKMYIADEKAISKYRERPLIEQEISNALSEDRVEVYLQPIYSNTEQKFTSAEALVRIRKKDGSLLPPDTFIPYAESSGQIVRLGERVFEKVCEFLKNSKAVSLGIHYVEVNLSVVQCEMTDLADRLIAIIEKYGIDAKLINLEITESASVKSRTVLLKNMEKLIDYGFTFSLDDFGKGQSNLMYVVEMPVSIIKLDYDMSKAFFSTPKAKQVVRAVVSMAHGMNLKLVAEGIETEEEIDGMRKENIDYIQGYYYSRPLPMNEFLEFIEK